jgi:hypothetical protein
LHLVAESGDQIVVPVAMQGTPLLK